MGRFGGLVVAMRPVSLREQTSGGGDVGAVRRLDSFAATEGALKERLGGREVVVSLVENRQALLDGDREEGV